MNIDFRSWLCVLAAAGAACGSDVDEPLPADTDTDSDTGEADSNVSGQRDPSTNGAPTTDGEPTTTDGEPTTTDGEPTTTDSEPTTTDSEPDTEGDTDTDTDTEGESDPACLEDDPAVDASFSVALEGWDGVELGGGYARYNVDDDCLISSVDAAGGVWTTELDCGDDEAPRTATLSVAAADEGDPAWSVGDAVHLLGRADASDFGGSEYISIIRDGVVLMQAISGDDVKSTLNSLTEPIDATASYDTCNAPMRPVDADIGRLSLSFDREGQTLELVSGHRGSLSFDDGDAVWIDVEHAESNHCCHGFHWFHVLERRTAPTQ